MNKVIVDGRIMKNTEKAQNMFHYVAGSDGTGKRSVLSFVISSYKNYGKPDENGYYPTNLFSVKAFGPKADFIYRNFKEGDAILIEGSMEVEKGTDKPDGTKWPDRTVIYVDNQYFCAKGAGDSSVRPSTQSYGSTAAAPVTIKKMSTNAPF